MPYMLENGTQIRHYIEQHVKVELEIWKIVLLPLLRMPQGVH